MAVAEGRRQLFLPLRLMGTVYVLVYPRYLLKYLQLRIWQKLLCKTREHDPFYFLQHRHYLSRRLTVRQRVESAIAHHEYESKNYSANYEKLVYRAEGIRLWEQKIGDRHFSITLTGSEHNRHEGDLSVVLSYDDINLWRISFSYVRGEIFNLDRRDFLFLTRNQAEASDRRIFQECFGQNQPQLFCLSAVCGIVMANGWDSLLAIRHDDQIAYEKTLDSGFYNSYNALWKQFSAREIDGRVFEMAAPLNLRPLTEVSRSHRGRARGRRQIWDSILRGAQATLVGYRQPPHSQSAN